MFEPVKYEDLGSNVKIKVIGVGGGGCNALDHIADSLANDYIANDYTDIELVAINTDVQALRKSKAQNRLQIGGDLTKGLG